MKSYFAQTSFVAGEISPRLLGRPDSDIYKTGLSKLENMNARPHGPCERRGGGEFKAKLTDKPAARIFNFAVTASQAFPIAVAPGLLQVVGATGLTEDNNVVQNTSFDAGAANWTAVTANGGAVSFAVLGEAKLSVTGAGGSLAAVQQSTATVADDYYIVVERKLAATYRSLNIKLGTAAGLSDIALIVSNQRVVKQLVPVAGATVWVEVELLGGGVAGDVYLNQVGFYRDLTGDPVTFATLYTLADLREVRLEQPPGGNSAYLVHPKYSPQKLSYDPVADVWKFAPVAFVGIPAEWVDSNFPGSVTFFQGRSWWGGTPLQPETFWASKSGALEDLTTGSNPSDGMVSTLARKGAIRWMLGIKNLLIGTDTGEHIVTSAGGVIAPGDISVQQQSAFGATSFAGAVPIGNTAAYVTGDRRKLRLAGYRWEEQAWVSVDLTFPSEHISEGLLSSLAWAQSPENLVLMVDATGDLVACTYEPTLKITGWQKHTSWAPLYDACPLVINGVAEIWVSRIRTEGVNTHVYIERIDPEVFMDSFVSGSFMVPTDTITGLEHLEGEVVQVLADGAVHPDRTVVGGQIELQAEILEYIVGKQYISILTPLPYEATVAGGIAASLCAVKSIGKVFARVLQSFLPKIDEERPPDRTPSTPMDTAEPPTSGDVQVVNLGWDRRQQPPITQELPGPLTVLSIFGEMDVGLN